MGRRSIVAAVVAMASGCSGAPCNYTPPLLGLNFEGDCTDSMCGFAINAGTAQIVAAFGPGEHALQVTAGADLSRELAVRMPFDPTGRDASEPSEYVSMLIQCDPGARVRFEESVAETFRFPPPDGFGRRDSAVDAADVPVGDFGLGDGGLSDASIDSATPPFDAGMDASVPTLPPPRVRPGTAAIPAFQEWRRVQATFVSDHAPARTVASSSLTRLRIVGEGQGTCTIDAIYYFSPFAQCGVNDY